MHWILRSHEKEWHSDTRHLTDEPWKYYAQRKKPDTKGQKSHDSIHMKCPEHGNPRRQEADCGSLRQGLMEDWGLF